jgi:FAD/FMN-containing dehydrogenase/Fe-S oxidoreductase
MDSIKSSSGLAIEFASKLRDVVSGEVRTDPTTRILYSTDASIYQIEPLGVFFPRDLDDISTCMELASEYGVTLLPRGSGSSLAGQAIGPGFILDCSRHLDQIISINPEIKTATVEPGVILSTLNRFAEKHGLQFGPDPASAERATMGGVIGNNATGAHSIRYGMSAAHLLSADLVLSDGAVTKFDPVGIEVARHKARQESVEGNIYQTALMIREDYAQVIHEDWPKTWRRSSGYNLNYLLPWSPSMPPQWNTYNQHPSAGTIPYPPVNHDELNLAQLIAGSEGTLGIIHRAEVSLVPKPKSTKLVILAFEEVIRACEAVEEILQVQPSAIELIPKNMIRLADSIPFYAQQIDFLKQIFPTDNQIPNLLAVEFAGDNPDQLRKILKRLVDQHQSSAFIADDPDLQERIWTVRKVGLGLLMSISGDLKPIPFIEDISIPVEKLSQFVSELERILSEFGTKGDFYAHASAGCLHLRPLINLKSIDGVEKMRAIANAAIELVIRLDGVPSGEHGDGIARSEWLDLVFGPRISELTIKLKNAADPNRLLNPGKIVEPLSMDENLRFGDQFFENPWKTVLDFSKQDGFTGAVELCNGAGVCRKTDGVMCPSFQVTKEEIHSTRGRANLLRALISNTVPNVTKIGDEEIFDALDLCVACKGCKAECPSGVDMAKLKYEFLEHHYSSSGVHRHPPRDYLFGHIDKFSQLGMIFRPLTNFLLENINETGIIKNLLGLSTKRNLPPFAKNTLHTLFKQSDLNDHDGNQQSERVLFLSDPFTEYYHPEIGLAAIEVLRAIGCEVELLPIIGSGRTLLSKGFLKSTRKHAESMVESIMTLDEHSQAYIVGIEPSEIYTLRDEYLDLFPGKDIVKSIASRAYMVDEFLIRPDTIELPRILRIADILRDLNLDKMEVLLHGHCYQKSQPPAADGYPIGEQATVKLLERVGFQVDTLDSGCCGMAGAFGYESEHYDLSMGIGELSLFPEVRKRGENCVISTSGTSCMTQIKDGTGKEALHPITLIHKRLSESL